MNPMKTRKPTPEPERPINTNPLTYHDKLRIINAITDDGHVKGILECVCYDDPGREAVEDFLLECRRITLTVFDNHNSIVAALLLACVLSDENGHTEQAKMFRRIYKALEGVELNE